MNPGERDAETDIIIEAGIDKLFDVYSDDVLEVKNGVVKILVPAYTGRVYHRL